MLHNRVQITRDSKCLESDEQNSKLMLNALLKYIKNRILHNRATVLFIFVVFINRNN